METYVAYSEPTLDFDDDMRVSKYVFESKPTFDDIMVALNKLHSKFKTVKYVSTTYEKESYVVKMYGHVN